MHRSIQRSGRRDRQRGLTLLEGLMSLVAMMLGTLALGKIQADLLVQGTQSQSRVMASHLADEVLARAITDPQNAACYAVPASAACRHDGAREQVTEWLGRVEGSLPQARAAVAYDEGEGRLAIVLSWADRAKGERHEVRMATDVRQ